MTDRLKSMKRILKVQDGIKRMADWRLAEAERERAEAAEAGREIAAFIDREMLTGPLAIAAVAQSGRLGERVAAAVLRAEAEAEALRDATARQKLAGRAVADLGRAERQRAERKDLERLVEAFAARAPAGESRRD